LAPLHGVRYFVPPTSSESLIMDLPDDHAIEDWACVGAAAVSAGPDPLCGGWSKHEVETSPSYQEAPVVWAWPWPSDTPPPLPNHPPLTSHAAGSPC